MLPKAEFDEIVRNTEWVKRAVIVFFLAMIAAFSAAVFGATYELTDQAGNRVVLHDEPCPVAFLKGWRKASFTWEGKDLKACWVASGGTVFLLDELGDLTPAPVQAFTKLQEG